ncbi:MAG: alpha/beta fold hydrolase [Acidimicrobiia bacterium]|nr:alpha/beta fold hydrolase [Acidimicrobiia bacterium]
MTAVFVHGVPETTAIWDPLIAAIDRDVCVALALPGFGNPLPDGFDTTKEGYAAWLAEALSLFDEVDLVAHDWGALLAMRVLADRPANVRTWVLDTGDLDESFRWHDAARTWQTPGDGEAYVEAWLALPAEERGAGLHSVGAPQRGARQMAEAIDATMCEAILPLYRSATEIGREWGPGIDSWTGRGLIIGSMKDRFRSPRLVAQLAQRTGAEVLDLAECGHWWMLEEPELVAEALQRHWGDTPS